jgi:hypothetical protein
MFVKDGLPLRRSTNVRKFLDSVWVLRKHCNPDSYCLDRIPFFGYFYDFDPFNSFNWIPRVYGCVGLPNAIIVGSVAMTFAHAATGEVSLTSFT